MLGPTLVLNGVGRTVPYKVYAGTLTSGVSPLVLDVFTDLGDEGCRGFVENQSVSASFTVAFSFDGTNYGDEITVLAGKTLNLDYFARYKKARLTRVSADSVYQVVAF